MTALDPTRLVRDQVSDALQSKRPEEIVSRLEMVGLPTPERVAASYPHQLSGGMAQRVAIAIAIARNPKIIVADEPTASLDASIRTQILDLLISLSEDLGAAVLLLSHDLRALARYCRTVAVMYGGRVVETGQTDAVFTTPSHPYTEALLLAAPGVEDLDGWLQPIPGMQTVLTERQDRCAFAPRCRWAVDTCFTVRPEVQQVDGRLVVCHRAQDVLQASVDGNIVGSTRGEEVTQR
jgi:oligopeptide/dipeptide ABC transporter ATP-binding protein